MAKELRCFIIGEMRDPRDTKPRLEVLKDEVITPLIDEFTRQSPLLSSYLVQTPFGIGDGQGAIMDEVIKAIDRADIIIADITGNNPNVFYELGIAHSLGKPAIMVREYDPAPEAIPPFDIRAYYRIDIELKANKYDNARDMLRKPIFTAIEITNKWEFGKNPVTDFYTEPLTSISPAAGLAQGYYNNFLRRVADNMTATHADQSSFRFKIRIGKKVEGEWQDGSIYVNDHDDRAYMKLKIVVPDRVELGVSSSIQKIRRFLLDAEVEDGKRPITLFAIKMGPQYHLIDVPSTIYAAETAIQMRMDRYKKAYDRNSSDWRRVEQNEVSRFMYEIRSLIERDNPELRHTLRRIIEIERFSTDEGYNAELDPFYKAWG